MRYTIRSQSDDKALKFSINPTTGEMRPTSELRYAFDPHQFRMIVTVTEQYSNNASSVLVSSQQIFPQNVNDSEPIKILINVSQRLNLKSYQHLFHTC